MTETPRIRVDWAGWARAFVCWLVAAAAGAYPLRCMVSAEGTFYPGSPAAAFVVFAAGPVIYGGALGLACTGYAPWLLLLLGGALAAAGLAAREPLALILFALALTVVAPAPVVALAGWAARRARLSPRARLVAAFTLAAVAAAAFGLANHLNWMPKTQALDDGPVWGV